MDITYEPARIYMRLDMYVCARHENLICELVCAAGMSFERELYSRTFNTGLFSFTYVCVSLKNCRALSSFS